MTESNLISDGILLMAIGMGTVFVFLSLLVFLTSMLFRLLGEQPVEAVALHQSNHNEDEIAAITAAVHAFRLKNKPNKNTAKKDPQ